MLCSVCFGDPTSSLTISYQYGILTLLACICVLLSCFGVLFFKIRNRSKSQHLMRS